MPQQAGDYALWHGQPRPGTRSGTATELFVKDPTGAMFALIPEVHSWSFDGEGRASVSPSIVSPDHSFHGYLSGGVWS